MNRVCLGGRLAADPEVVETKSDTSITRLRVAVDEYIKQEKRAFFFTVTVFGKQAESCATHLSKGSPVCVDARLRTRTWEKDDGGKGFDYDIVADRVDFMGAAGEAPKAKPEPRGEEPDEGQAW